MSGTSDIAKGGGDAWDESYSRGRWGMWTSDIVEGGGGCGRVI